MDPQLQEQLPTDHNAGADPIDTLIAGEPGERQTFSSEVYDQQTENICKFSTKILV